MRQGAGEGFASGVTVDLHFMRRRRPVFAAVACVLALGFIILEVVSFRIGYFVSMGIGDARSTNAGQFFLMANRGAVTGGWQRTFTEPARWQAFTIDPYPFGRFGFVAVFSGGTYIVGVPFWLLACVAACAAIYFWRRVTIPGATLCAHCGYDLRATPDRCPECGAVREKIEASPS